MCKPHNSNQAVESENLANAATNLVTNSIQHICKKVDATYDHFNLLDVEEQHLNWLAAHPNTHNVQAT
jgi:hypothetical protein